MGTIRVGKHRLDSLLVVGPLQWITDHMKVIEERRYTWMQYDARAGQTQELLERFREEQQLPVDLFIYVPHEYTGGGVIDPPIPGNGLIEFCAKVSDWKYRPDGRRLRPPEPRHTVAGPMGYDIHQDLFTYPYWFRANRIERCRHAIEDFLVYQRAARVLRPVTASVFAPSRRPMIAFAQQIL